MITFYQSTVSINELKESRSLSIGEFAPLNKKGFESECAYVDACVDQEIEIRENIGDWLASQGHGTEDIEVRLNEFKPGEIRLYY